MSTPAWMGWWLRGAAAYNVLWGAWAVLLPGQFWRLVGMDAPNYPFLWQCIGMIVGVYGVGYWIAARDPVRHWPIVLVGLLGKVLGPVGFLDAWLVREMVPARFGVVLLTNDLLWWAPFGMILAHAWRRGRAAGEREDAVMDVREAMAQARTARGESLLEMSRRGAVLVVFLRHLGCTFCREALADLRARRGEIEGRGVTICLVHMSEDAEAGAFFARYGLGDVARISDPGRGLYRAFELRRGNLWQLFGPSVIARGIAAFVRGGHGVGRLRGDGFQMPGAFVVRDGRIVRAFRHAAASDRPDYCALAGAESEGAVDAGRAAANA
jgi:peroxiredoxin